MCNVIKNSHPDLAKFGLEFIKNGADIFRDVDFPPQVPPYPIKNKLLEELASKHLIELYHEGKFLGPFRDNEIPFRVHINPIFVKEKDLSRQKILFLFDFSAPKGNSVNSKIPKEFTTLAYPEFIFYIRSAAWVGPSGWISVADLKNAYYNVFIKSLFKPLLSVKWLGKTIIPNFMPFGIATGCRTLQLLLDVVEIALRKIFPNIFCPEGRIVSDHYLDDQAAFHKDWFCAWLQNTIWIIVVSLIGLPFSIAKVQFPSKSATLLGFVIDLTSQTYSLRDKKVQKYMKFIVFLINNRHRATIKRVQKITGRLRYAGRAIQGGNAFVRGLEYQNNQMIKKGFSNFKYYSLDNEAYHDLLYWRQILPKYNSIPFSYLLRKEKDIDITLFTDASGSPKLGYGAWDTAGNWFAIPWSTTCLCNKLICNDIFINELEFITVCMAMLKFIEDYKNKYIHIRCDNMSAVIWIIKKAPSFSNKYHKLVSFLLRKLMIKCLEKRVYFWIDYIDTKNNNIADALSRLKQNPFKTRQSGINVLPKLKKGQNPNKLMNSLVKAFL